MFCAATLDSAIQIQRLPRGGGAANSGRGRARCGERRRRAPDLV